MIILSQAPVEKYDLQRTLKISLIITTSRTRKKGFEIRALEEDLEDLLCVSQLCKKQSYICRLYFKIVYLAAQ